MQSKSHCTDATGIQQSRTEQNTCGTQTPESAIFTKELGMAMRMREMQIFAHLFAYIVNNMRQYAPICAMRDWKILAEDHP